MPDNLNKYIERLKQLPLPHQCRTDKNIKICMIIPPSPFVVPSGWEWVHTAPFEGPSIMAAIFRGLGYKFELLDQRENPDPEILMNLLKDYDIITIATYEDSFPYIKRATEIAKEINSSTPVILGGSLISSEPQIIMENTLADFAVIGEGEITTIELLDFIIDRKGELVKIKGISYKKENSIIVNEEREPLGDLDLIPFQDLSVWKRYNKNIDEIYLSTSRGCHYSCSFCYRTHPQYRVKSIERVKKEIEYLKEYHFKHAWINDLSFTCEPERIQRLMDESFSVYSFSWNCFARVNEVDLMTLKKMKEQGCDIILYGFEAISQEILNSYNKKLTKDDMINAVKSTREANIKVGGLFIIGAPYETKGSLIRIREFVKEYKEITRVKYLAAIPGTPLYHKMLEEGIIKDPVKHLTWLSREQSIEEDIDDPDFLFMAKNVSKEELKKAYHDINYCIEIRPYNYNREGNSYLNQPKKFKKRI